MAFRDKRRFKRTINWYAKRVRVGSFVCDCRYHPCVVTKAYLYPEDPFESSIECVSLIDGGQSACSMLHCGPEPITEDVAKEGARIAKEAGFDAFLRFRGFSQEAVDWYNDMTRKWSMDASADNEISNQGS